MKKCNFCGGLLGFLCRLGRKNWFRCRDCGADCCEEVVVDCPRCNESMTEEFYCISCGFIPPKKDPLEGRIL